MARALRRQLGRGGVRRRRATPPRTGARWTLRSAPASACASARRRDRSPSTSPTASASGRCACTSPSPSRSDVHGRRPSPTQPAAARPGTSSAAVADVAAAGARSRGGARGERVAHRGVAGRHGRRPAHLAVGRGLGRSVIAGERGERLAARRIHAGAPPHRRTALVGRRCASHRDARALRLERTLDRPGQRRRPQRHRHVDARRSEDGAGTARFARAARGRAAAEPDDRGTALRRTRTGPQVVHDIRLQGEADQASIRIARAGARYGATEVDLTGTLGATRPFPLSAHAELRSIVLDRAVQATVDASGSLLDMKLSGEERQRNRAHRRRRAPRALRAGAAGGAVARGGGLPAGEVDAGHSRDAAHGNGHPQARTGDVVHHRRALQRHQCHSRPDRPAAPSRPVGARRPAMVGGRARTGDRARRSGRRHGARGRDTRRGRRSHGAGDVRGHRRRAHPHGHHRDAGIRPDRLSAGQGPAALHWTARAMQEVWPWTSTSPSCSPTKRSTSSGRSRAWATDAPRSAGASSSARQTSAQLRGEFHAIDLSRLVPGVDTRLNGRLNVDGALQPIRRGRAQLTLTRQPPVRSAAGRSRRSSPRRRTVRHRHGADVGRRSTECPRRPGRGP